ncbi:hypothetical protein BJX70DRAFT_206745 [Aspergillus crustosus]
MISDHLLYFDDKEFVSPFLPVIDAVLWDFHSRIDHQSGLSTSELRPGIWNYVDWTPQWMPHGVLPPAILRTGVSTFVTQLYAYTLSHAAQLANALGRHALAGEYTQRANNIIHALQTHCFTGTFFSDTIISQLTPPLTSASTARSGAFSAAPSLATMRRSFYDPVSNNNNTLPPPVADDRGAAAHRAVSGVGGGGVIAGGDCFVEEDGWGGDEGGGACRGRGHGEYYGAGFCSWEGDCC